MTASGGKTRYIVAVDIGGTSSRFARYEVEAGAPPVQRDSVWLDTQAADSFDALLKQLPASGFSLPLTEADLVVFAVAGPIRGSYCKPPNIRWDIELTRANEQWGIRRWALINDFLAQAFAACSPLGDSSRVLLSGVRDPKAPIGVIGAGTGLGKAVLIPTQAGGYLGMPSEGGHTNFCPESQQEFDFMQFVKSRLDSGFVAWDDIVSGRGLSYIHEFLTGDALTPKEVADAALQKESETLRWFSRFYGRVCRNFALETLAHGGVFIAGGVAAKNELLVTHGAFRESFIESRVHSALLQSMPVMLIDNEESGLWGAAYYGWYELGSDEL